MEQLIHYFEIIPSWHRSLILAAGLIFFYCLEFRIPFIIINYNKPKHLSLNLFLTVTTLIMNVILAFTIVNASSWARLNKFGLLYIFHMPILLFLCVGMLVLDFIGAYLIHLIEHKVKWLWPFHIIHHLDEHVDASTANRHHPMESVFRLIFTVLAVITLGAPIWLVFLYQTCSVAFSQFNHANIKLPTRFDTALSLLFVSPNMHKVHHHKVQPYTDCNYGNIFSIWDRLFGTYKKLHREHIKYGLDSFPKCKENESIITLLKIPFLKKNKTNT